MADSTGFRVTRMYHPSHHAPDLDGVEQWFERVFGVKSRPLEEMFKLRPPSGSDYPTSYATFTPIREVLFDTIDPKLYVLQGIQRYKSVDKPHLKTIGWFVDDPTEVYRAIRKQGITMVDQLDNFAEGDDPPRSPDSPMPLFFTTPEAAGLRHEFLPQFPFPLDHRSAPDWSLPPVTRDDPLGIEFCSHHTLLTSDPARELVLLVDAVGATVIHEGRDELLGATSTYVHLADSVVELAVPDEGTAAHVDWQATAPNDTYHTIAWKVVDLDRVADHLTAEGVGIRQRTDDSIVTDPDTSIGVPWVFTTTYVPGDPRGIA